MTDRVIPQHQRGSAPMTVMLDSNAYDALVDGPDDGLDALLSAIASGELRVLTTHVQRDQLQATPMPDRAQQLLRTLELVEAALLPTSAFVLDFSPLDGAQLADDATATLLDELRDHRTHDAKDTADALIAITAYRNGAILVTNDGSGRKRGLLDRCRDAGVPCMSVAAFLAALVTPTPDAHADPNPEHVETDANADGNDA